MKGINNLIQLSVSKKNSVSRSHLVSRWKVRYLSNSYVNHHHHISAVEDVCSLSIGENILQKLEYRVRCGRGVFEHTHRVVWGRGGKKCVTMSEGKKRRCRLSVTKKRGIFTASVQKQQHFLWQDLDILFLQLLHDHIAAGCWVT